MAEEPDRLSELPDELLQRILHLAPCREAESTAVLSRRWRGLWPPATTGAVKIDISSSGDGKLYEEALAASHGPVQRLAIHVGEGCNSNVDVVGDVLSHPASRSVQDLRIRADTYRDMWTAAAAGDVDESWSWMPDWSVGEFELSFASVPSAALRVLHLTNCVDLTPPPPAPESTFPCVEVLRLRRCSIDLQRLQDMVVASPQLAALQLEYLYLSTGRYSNSDDYDVYGYGRSWDLPESFCCPGITTLVLLNCCCKREDDTIELDVPRVQHFRYRGKINQFTLRSPLPDVRRAYLHILSSYRGDDESCRSFWRFLKNFSGAKVLKLKLDWPIGYVADHEISRIRDLQIGENQSAQSIMFCVEQLEIDAPDSRDTGVAIGNLIQCCPVLHDLSLKLNIAEKPRRRRNWSQLEFQQSIDHFRRRRDPPVHSCGDNNGKIVVCDIAGLSDRWFHFKCLQFHLKRLSLKFHMDKDNPNCIGVQLVKFFIGRGMALEQMCIDDGNMKLWEHMNCKIGGYAANPHQPFSEYDVLTRLSPALSMNKFSSSSKISRSVHLQKLEVRRRNPWSTSRSFTILPLADK